LVCSPGACVCHDVLLSRVPPPPARCRSRRPPASRPYSLSLHDALPISLADHSDDIVRTPNASCVNRNKRYMCRRRRSQKLLSHPKSTDSSDISPFHKLLLITDMPKMNEFIHVTIKQLK